MRASLPAAAQALASVLASGSGVSASRMAPTCAPQGWASPSCAMARLQESCASSRSCTRARSTVSANSRISATFSTLLSVRLSSCESVNGFCSSTSPSRLSNTMFVWLFAICTAAVCAPAWPVRRMSRRRVVSAQRMSMGVASAYAPMAACLAAGTSAMTCSSRAASPATTPAAMAAAMPLRPPVLGTTTHLTFLMMLPEISALDARGGRAQQHAQPRGRISQRDRLGAAGGGHELFAQDREVGVGRFGSQHGQILLPAGLRPGARRDACTLHSCRLN